MKCKKIISCLLSATMLFTQGTFLSSVFAASDPQITEGLVVTASKIAHNDSSNYGTQNAVDGNLQTRWYDGDNLTNGNWLNIDMSDSYRVSEIKIMSTEASTLAAKYSIEYSEDGVNYSVVDGYSSINPIINDQSISISPPIVANHIRLKIAERGAWGTSIHEIKLFGRPYRGTVEDAKQDLHSAVDVAKSLIPGDYTSESFGKLKATLELAQDLLDKNSQDKEVLISATMDIRAARGKLVESLDIDHIIWAKDLAVGSDPGYFNKEEFKNVINETGMNYNNSTDLKNATHVFNNSLIAHTDENPGENAWYTVDFGRVENLDEMYIWNLNQGAAYPGNENRDAKTIEVYYTEDAETDDNWIKLGDKYTVAQSKKLKETECGLSLNMGGKSARRVKIKILESYGGSYIGLGKILFTRKHNLDDVIWVKDAKASSTGAYRGSIAGNVTGPVCLRPEKPTDLENTLHIFDGERYWVNNSSTDKNPWITIDMGKNEKLKDMFVWNLSSNKSVETKNFELYYSNDSDPKTASWTKLGETHTVPQSTSNSTLPQYKFGVNVEARLVKLELKQSYGANDFGLGKILFSREYEENSIRQMEIELQAAINAVNVLKKSDFNLSSWIDLKSAAEVAEELLKTSNYTIESLDAAAAGIRDSSKHISKEDNTPIIKALEATNTKSGSNINNVIDEDKNTAFLTDESGTTSTITVTCDPDEVINTVYIEEIKDHATKIDSVKIEYLDVDNKAVELKNVDCSEIPYLQNIFFNDIKTSKILITISSKATGSMSITEMKILRTLKSKMPASDSVSQPIKPSKEPNMYQQKMIDSAYTMFIHYGMNTFANLEWSFGNIDAKTYNPSTVNAEQWVKTAYEAGMKTVLITTKHHDGFCLWDSEYTDYDVGSSGNTTDVIKALSDACDKYGINLGLYYSAWDNNWDKQNYKHDDAAYNKYAMNQIEELMGGKYGKKDKDGRGVITELWIDGAWEKSPERWEFDKLYGKVKELQPECQFIVNMTIHDEDDPTASGIILPGDQQDGDPIRYFPSDFRTQDAFSTLEDDPKFFSHRGQMYYMPFEATFTLHSSWFWHPGYGSYVGMGADTVVANYNKYKRQNNVTVLNCGPTTDGVLDQSDIDILYEAARKLNIAKGDATKKTEEEIYKQYMQESSGPNLIPGATVTGEHTWDLMAGFEPEKMIDGDNGTRWATFDGFSTTNAEITLDSVKEFNSIVITEPSSMKRAEKITIDYLDNGSWTTIVADQPFNNGEFCFSNLIKTDKIRFSFYTSKKDGPTIEEITVCKIKDVNDVIVEFDKTSIGINDTANVKVYDKTTTDDIVNLMSYATFKSSDEKVLTVDSNGKITPLTSGTAKIITTVEIFGQTLVKETVITVEDGTLPTEPINKADLTSLIAYAKDQQADPEYKYVVPDVRVAFENAIQNAEALIASDTATQTEVDNAYTELLSKVWMLEYKGNSEKLAKLVAQVQAIKNLDQYTPATVAILQDKLGKAVAAIADGNILQNELDVLFTDLQNALFELRLIPNKDKLNDLINSLKAIDTRLLTPASASTLNAGITSAVAVFTDENATQAQIDAEVTALNNIKANLEYVKDDTATDDKTEANDKKDETTEKVPTTNDTTPIFPITAIIMLAGITIFAGKKIKEN